MASPEREADDAWEVIINLIAILLLASLLLGCGSMMKADPETLEQRCARPEWAGKPACEHLRNEWWKR